MSAPIGLHLCVWLVRSADHKQKHNVYWTVSAEHFRRRLESDFYFSTRHNLIDKVWLNTNLENIPCVKCLNTQALISPSAAAVVNTNSQLFGEATIGMLLDSTYDVLTVVWACLSIPVAGGKVHERQIGITSGDSQSIATLLSCYTHFTFVPITLQSLTYSLLTLRPVEF